ncbi:FAD-linked oxidase [Intrasporangium oryzae NRRL B-24470]|uniref:FAD-linked oxidase n=1 Tax=Intrasporangium oryzae NRRL B-24470 TaxID=1386089 RepID=W9G2B6_9MICO|nr:FAD-linked oxidase [Intrasporangium oryzae NRRL B-24470]
MPWVELADRLKGALLTPAHPEWEAARMPWTVNVDQRPAAIALCADVEDVVTAVRWAGEHGISVTAQPSGHSARRTLDGTLLLRTRGLDGIHVDLERRVARVGAGTKFGELLAALDGTGLAPLVGSNPDPSVVGFTLGGGISWLSRKHGFTANSVLSLDVVDADGSARRVDAESDPDLFWALRGGGGDFAIVTGMELRLYAADDLYGGRLLWPVHHAGAVLRAFRDLALMAPRDLSVWAHIMHFPPLPELPEPIRGRSFVTVAALCLGGEHLGEALLWRLRESAPVELDLMGPVSIAGIGDVADEPTEPMPILEHAMLLEALDDEAIDALVAATSDSATCPLMIVQVRGLGGAFADRPADGGAVCAVDAPFGLWAAGVPATPELASAIPGAFDDLDAALGRLATGRRMPNLSGEGQPDSAGYDPDTLARLQEIKRARDPRGVIRSNKPVLGPTP